MAAWIQLGHGAVLEITDSPTNYPRLNVGVSPFNPYGLKAHILRLQADGWVMQKDNILTEDQSQWFQSMLRQRQTKWTESLAREIDVAANNHCVNTGEDHYQADIEDLRFELQKLGAVSTGTLAQMILQLSPEKFFSFCDSFNDPDEAIDSTPRILASDNPALRELIKDLTRVDPPTSGAIE